MAHGEQGLVFISPSDAEPLLERLAALAPKPADVVDLYERQVTRSKAPADRVRALARAAQVASTRGQPERARGFFELALSGAPGTDAYQTNRNLVLNDGARADTIPFLEIETAEVKCSHAGAVGRVDDEHLFYLQSRGVPTAEAKRLIVMGFLQEVLEQVSLEELREELEAAVQEKLA